MRTDGDVIIGTALTTDKFDKQIGKLEKRISDKEMEIDVQLGNIEEAKRKLKEANIELEKMMSIQKTGQTKISTLTAEYEELYQKIYKSGKATIEEHNKFQQLESTLIDLNKEQKILDKQVEKYNEKVEIANNNLTRQESKYTKLNNQLNEMQANLTQIKTQQSQDFLKNTGKSLTGIIKKVVIWGVALFSVRSIYGAIHKSMNTISQTDEQLASDIQYMNQALAYMLESIVKKIVEWAYKLLKALQWIIYVFTGKNIFANANKGLEYANKQAKQLSKQLASFDEMNILSENKNKQIMPSEDLSKLDIKNMPNWVKKLQEYKDLIIQIAVALLGLFAGAQFAKIMGGIATLKGASGLAGLTTAFGKLLAAMLLVANVVIWANLIKQAIEYKIQLQEIVKLQEKLRQKNDEVHDSFIEQLEAGKLNKEQIDSYINSLETEIELQSTSIQKTKDSITWIDKLTGADESKRQSIEKSIQAMQDTITKYDELNKKNALSEEQQINYKKALEETIKMMEENGKNADNLKIQYEKLTGQTYTIKIDADTNNAEKNMGNFMTKFGQTLAQIVDFRNWGSGWGTKIKNIWSKNAKGAIIYPNKPLKLAKGAVINNPGQGVPIAPNAIGGEKGAEGLIPLTDAQQMEMLGKMIGKYTNITITNVTKLNSRTIAKELKNVNAEDDFAFNN